MPSTALAAGEAVRTAVCDYHLQQVRSSEQAADGKQILSANLAD